MITYVSMGRGTGDIFRYSKAQMSWGWGGDVFQWNKELAVLEIIPVFPHLLHAGERQRVHLAMEQGTF